MIFPDYRTFRYLSHSAKGSVWDKHKYVKRVNGIYYYPNNYDGARTMDSFRRDLRNKRFTQKQASSDASNKSKTSSSSTSTSTKKKISYTTVRKSLAQPKQERKSLNDFSRLEGAAEKLKGTSSGKKATDKNLSAKEIENFAKEVIRGKYGNGAKRKKTLGSNYSKIQSKVNELLKGIGKSNKKAASKITSNAGKKTTKETKKESTKTSKKKNTKKETSTSSSATTKNKGIELDKVYSIYNKKKR